MLFAALCALVAMPAPAGETKRDTDRTDAFHADIVEVQGHRNFAAVIATDAVYGGIAGLAIGAGVALIENDHNWGRDLSVGAGAGLLIGAAFGAIDAANADRTMSAADLAARDRIEHSQSHPATLGYRIGF
jgi:hypothetical protein